EVELQRVHMAKAEAIRRQVEDTEREQQKVVADGMKRAGELEHDRQQAAQRVDRAFRAAADALAAHQGIAAQQAQALSEAGRHPEGWRTVMTPGWVIEAALCHALTTAGAPAAWTEISQLAV